MEMLERLKRFRNLDGLPKVQLQSPYEFFLKAEQDKDKYLTWVGELVYPSLSIYGVLIYVIIIL